MSSASQTLPFVLNLIAGIFGALGQYLYKQGTAKLTTVPIYLNWQILVGVASFIVVMVLFIAAFRLGGLLSVTYPAYATTFVWAALISYFILGESIQLGQVIGIGLIVLGVSCIGYFSTPA